LSFSWHELYIYTYICLLSIYIHIHMYIEFLLARAAGHTSITSLSCLLNYIQATYSHLLKNTNTIVTILLLNPAFFRIKMVKTALSVGECAKSSLPPIPMCTVTPKSNACCVQFLKRIAFMDTYEGALSTAKKNRTTRIERYRSAVAQHDFIVREITRAGASKLSQKPPPDLLPP
jgi:hypothetical protein